ncbi:hydrolase 76 protein [Xylographa vitiligo]|nr:hydrolase 76 protein [Xylographa vitiligo]
MYIPLANIHLLATVSWLSLAGAIPLDVNNETSIKQAASTIAYGLMSYYTGNQSSSPVAEGTFPAPYYWWEAGAVWGAMIDYWHYTNDSTYNDVVAQALLSQISPTKDFMPPAEAGQEGNDDQFFWAAAAMSAAERNFPSPSTPSPWLSLAAAAFTSQTQRWNTATCRGGLKWQIFPSNTGYDYKNTAANGGFFQLAARLFRYTGSATYQAWATTAWDWMAGVGLVDAASCAVYDGTQDAANCSQVNELAFSYTHGMLLAGCAALANASAPPASALWAARAAGLLASSARFLAPFPNLTAPRLVLYEPACEPAAACDADQLSFKALLARWLAAAAQLLPDLTDAVAAVLQRSAQAAARACAGGEAGVTCGQKWYVGGFDGSVGVGQQLGALEVVQGLLVGKGSPPAVAPGVVVRVVAAGETAPVPTGGAAPTAGAGTGTGGGGAGGGAALGGAGRVGVGGWIVGLGVLGAVVLG